MPVKQVTKKPTRKVWTQMIVSLLSYLAFFLLGVDLDPELQGSLSVVVGFVVAYFVPPSEQDQIEVHDKPL